MERICKGQNEKIQLYDLTVDVSELNDLADTHPDIVEEIDAIMESAVIPSEFYPIGKKYTGGPIWKKE